MQIGRECRYANVGTAERGSGKVVVVLEPEPGVRSVMIFTASDAQRLVRDLSPQIERALAKA